MIDDDDTTDNGGNDANPFAPIARVRKDIMTASRTLSRREARYLVDLYYQIQDSRIRAAAQLREALGEGEPAEITRWVFDSQKQVEETVKRALGRFAGAHREGEWAMSVHGIGPVISAGLLAHIDIEKAPTVGHIWRFAGLDPTVRWEKGTKRPWNAALKRLCWIIGGSFVRCRASESDVYGRVYEARKADEMARNERCDYAEQAAAALTAKRYGADTTARACYEAGKLPPARIDLRARRYAAKLFLSHYHHVAYEVRHGTPPPKPYILEHGGHVHFVAPPNWPVAERGAA